MFPWPIVFADINVYGLKLSLAGQAFAAAVATVSRSENAASVERPASILLAEDNSINQDIARAVLEAAGHIVDVVDDGEAAVAAVISKVYDLVLMDIEMPGMNGFEAAARIRAREGVMSGVTIAALTATRQADAELFAFWSGIDTFIHKPIEPKRLLARVGEVVAQG